VYPNEMVFNSQYEALVKENGGNRWVAPVPILEELKAKAKEAGLWNLFLSKNRNHNHGIGPGLSNLEYAPLAEIMGRVPGFGSEVFNCAAPDTGNMEVLAVYGTKEQQEKWLKPLLNGEIRSCFGMTEPLVASSDATHIEASIERVEDGYIINARKWWISGAGDPRCKVCIFMGCSNPNAPKHRRQSMVLVPLDAPGVRIIRPMQVFGSDDAHMDTLRSSLKMSKLVLMAFCWEKVAALKLLKAVWVQVAFTTACAQLAWPSARMSLHSSAFTSVLHMVHCLLSRATLCSYWLICVLTLSELVY